MGRLKRLWLLVLGILFAVPGSGQTPPALRGADDRFKMDILVVVAHPDDEGGVTPYLARAIYDLHKRVAVVYGTRGGSGGNEYSRERGPALANIREMEAREACARLGITNVWFLDGKDTASQNVLNSLSNWGHGENLERLVGIIRLTRPEVIIAPLPGMFIGENHGDHQAAGVLATEAFDLAARPAIFPSQLGMAAAKREIYLGNMNPWQPKKLYYVPDAADEGQFAGSGPAYSITEVSPSQKKPYWRLALDAAMTHLTQYPGEIHALSTLSDAEIEKMISDPHRGWWSNPETLVFGKSAYEIGPDETRHDVFADVAGQASLCPMTPRTIERARGTIVARLGGPWEFYEEFRAMHCTSAVPSPKIPEIAIKSATTLSVPVTIYHDPNRAEEVTVSVVLPPHWKVTAGTGKFMLPAEARSQIQIQIETPSLSDAELKEARPETIRVTVDGAGETSALLSLNVLLKGSALPQ